MILFINTFETVQKLCTRKVDKKTNRTMSKAQYAAVVHKSALNSSAN